MGSEWFFGDGCEQAAAVSVTDEDCVLRDLKVAEARAVHWMNCTNQVRECADV